MEGCAKASKVDKFESNILRTTYVLESGVRQYAIKVLSSFAQAVTNGYINVMITTVQFVGQGVKQDDVDFTRKKGFCIWKTRHRVCLEIHCILVLFVIMLHRRLKPFCLLKATGFSVKACVRSCMVRGDAFYMWKNEEATVNRNENPEVIVWHRATRRICYYRFEEWIWLWGHLRPYKEKYITLVWTCRIVEHRPQEDCV